MVAEAQGLANHLRWENNTLRPHSALHGRMPLETAQIAAAQPPTLIVPGPMKGVTSARQAAD